jgi:hypothetical protein
MTPSPGVLTGAKDTAGSKGFSVVRLEKTSGEGWAGSG